MAGINEGKANKLICKYCGKLFCSTKDRRSHENEVHKYERPYQCDQCEKCYAHRNNLVLHRKIHTENAFKCKFCLKKFVCQSLRDTHELIHTGEKPFKCKYCEKTFNQTSYLTVHERTHTGDKRFCCEFCKKKFARPRHLKLHVRTHSNEKPFSCKFCLKIFAHANALKEHARIHAEDETHSCKRCGKVFARKSYLRKHEKRHSLVEIDDKQVSEPEGGLVEESVDPKLKHHRKVCQEQIEEKGLTIAQRNYSSKEVFSVKKCGICLKHLTLQSASDETCSQKCQVLSAIRTHRRVVDHVAKKLHNCKFCKTKFHLLGLVDIMQL